ncbi:hypothetical protein BCR33DRAFT_711762 [Rhizoclosmatium globosum]|uniref:Uncharacterized protein n=1 Tax=Rhizoclosmatium globosum TaxID=329046 RepID=A0A1Y2CZI7_9FUNG|nr:hypothetical protein BCR33DRAFT_711762 [Rhizoclosmatium globosum]|eukprot:ORY52448.1 hypothetical protein BCR33DRAFT_711762 [Rhizoclosmatium globosum]
MAELEQSLDEFLAANTTTLEASGMPRRLWASIWGRIEGTNQFASNLLRYSSGFQQTSSAQSTPHPRKKKTSSTWHL